MENHNNGDNNGANQGDNGNSTDETVQKIFTVMERIWRNIKLTVIEILHRIGAYDLYERIMNLSSQHPYLAVCAAMVLAAFLLPFIVIVLFALSTVVLTFSGFAILEGTLIAFISMVLFGCLGAIVLATLFFGGISLAGYFSVLQIVQLYNRIMNYPNRKNKRITESEK